MHKVTAKGVSYPLPLTHDVIQHIRDDRAALQWIAENKQKVQRQVRRMSTTASPTRHEMR